MNEGATAVVDDGVLLRLLRAELPDELASMSIWSTTGYWFRIARGISEPDGTGTFSRAIARLDPVGRAVVRARVDHLSDEVRIVDVRELVPLMARLASAHGLNLLAAEVVASALALGAEIVAVRGNVGPRLSAAAAALDLGLTQLD